MITTAEQYNENLHIIHNQNPPMRVVLPTPDNIYNIDIKTREIDAPQFLGVETDQSAETIYFIVDRYADYMDLSTASCIITYTNALGKTRYYVVPFYDIYSYDNKDKNLTKMLIPWCLDADVTEAPGEVEFSLLFFKTSEEVVGQDHQIKSVVSYKLNTLPAKSKVLSNMKVKQISEGYELNASEFEHLTQEINVLKQYLTRENAVLWTVLD